MQMKLKVFVTKNVVAVLSSTVLSCDGNFQYQELAEAPDLSGVPHYVGHPATKHLLGMAGATYTPGLFAGLSVGESFLVAQLKDPRKGQAFTIDQPNVEAGDLKWGVVTRLS